jgi:hypothetical protein
MTNIDKIVADIEIAVEDLERYAKQAFIDHNDLKEKRKRIMSLVHHLRRQIK